MKAFKKIGIDDEFVSKFQENVGAVFEEIGNKEILRGVLIKNISLVSGTPTEVPHLLGRELVGYLVIRKRSQSDVWDSQDANKLKNKTLILNCSANVVIDLWCF